MKNLHEYMKVSRIVFVPLMMLILLMISCNTTKQAVYPETEYELLKQAYKAFTKRDYLTAIQKYTHILDIYPESAEAYAFRGLCKYYLKDYEGAILDFDNALAYQPNYAEVYDLRGIARGELGDKDGACEDWKKAFELGFKPAFQLIKLFCWQE